MSDDIVQMLRLRACPPEGEFIEHDHGHSDCYLEREAADEIGRLRMEIVRLSTEQGESLMMIDRLRSIITAWADASKQVLEDEDDCHWDSLEISREVLLEAENALRKAVGR